MPAAYAKALAAEAAAAGRPIVLGVSEESLGDETQPVALSTFLAALQSVGPEVARRAGERLLDPPQLAVWSRLLRRARTAPDAFELLGSEEILGSASFYVETRTPTSVRGRLEFRHDPRLEEEPSLLAARLGVLATVPRLFGHVGARARLEEREVRVDWEPDAPRPLAAAVVALLAGGALAAWRLDALGVLLGVALGLGLGLGLQRARTARRASQRSARALQLRGAVMERQLTVSEEIKAPALGDFTGSVVAGLYRIESRMGTGASGVVYGARRITDQLPVAIKLLRAATAHDVVASDRLRREAEALGLSWHPNVVEVVDHGMLPDGTSYMVMEALVGESLAERLERGPLPVAEVLRLGVELGAALVAVHAAGVVHRDVKPDNVFLVEGAGPVHVKLLDFGIAKVEWEELRITHSGGPIGTPGFMAPEQERGEEADARADVFSLAAVLRASLAGTREDVPPAFLALLDRASSVVVTQRPDTRELSAELAALCSASREQATLEG